MNTAEDRAGIAIRMLQPANSPADFVDRLTGLVNAVYRNAETGLWRDGFARTSATELTGLIAAGKIAVATRDGRVTGSVQVQDIAADTCELGMLVADHDHRSTGVGRALVEFAERRGRERGRRVMQLELLVPRTWRHPHKDFLEAWYSRRGYRLIGRTTLAETHPHLVPLLATACDLNIYQKPLQSQADRPAG